MESNNNGNGNGKTKESVVDLIRKLLALTKSPNENEAAVAMVKAQELLLKHNLKMADITMGDDKEKNGGMVNQSYKKMGRHGGGSWRAYLLSMIARCNFCILIHTLTYDRQHVFHILGKEVNVEAVQVMYEWVMPQILRLRIGCRYNRRDKFVYFVGIINTIENRLKANIADFTIRNNATALIVRSEADLKEFTDKEFADVKPGKEKKVDGSMEAYMAGRRAGHEISLTSQNHQIGNGAPRLSAGR